VRIAIVLLSLLTLVSAQQPAFSGVEASIGDLQEAMRQKRVTSRGIVQQYLDRIAKYEGRLNAVITLNPRALQEADRLDRERAQGKVRGPLHGIPIALKDNIHTTDMATTGGALAFQGFVPPYEATLTKHLRDAGAVIIAKTNMTELANFVAVGMPGNYNALAGFGMNPYDPRRDPRSRGDSGPPALTVGGSSSGTGTAASFWAANVGTETSGSILSPANWNMLAAIKPTVGRVSRYGIIPITADQDTAGPMARTVADAALLLGALEGRAPDPHDAATARCPREPRGDYSRFLKSDALAGARIGVARKAFFATLSSDGARMMREAIAVLKERGAVVVDPVELENRVRPSCSGPNDARGQDDDCSIVLKYGMKRDFNAWIASLGPKAPVKSLDELRRWNLQHESQGALRYGQARLDNAAEMNVAADRPRYLADRAEDLRLSTTEGIDAAISAHELDALLVPALAYDMAARAGYPTVLVPFGFVPNPQAQAFPEGFAARPAPFGVGFMSTACTEPRLIALAYAFEQATKRRVPPSDFP
jgi:amidase